MSVYCAPDVALADEDAGVVDGLSETQLEDEGLQSALQEIGRHQRQHVIQLVLTLLQQPILVHTPHERLPLEQPLCVLCMAAEQPGTHDWLKKRLYMSRMLPCPSNNRFVSYVWQPNDQPFKSNH